MTAERRCVNCGRFIGNRHSHAKYCRPCAHEIDKKGRRINEKTVKYNNHIMNLNEKRDGRWILSDEYLKYQCIGGRLSPDKWNEIKRELYYDKKKHEMAKRKE